MLVVFLVLVAGLAVAGAFLGGRVVRGRSVMRMSDLSEEVQYDSLVISGFLKSQVGFAESGIFDAAHATQKYKEITAVADDILFARKRLMSPKAVYSGLIDVLQLAESDGSEESMAGAVAGKEAWVAFNVTTAELPVYASVAAKAGCKRVVFAVYLSATEREEDVTLDASTKLLEAAGVDYTILKFGDVLKKEEAVYPYRLVRADAALPQEDGLLSSGDLMRVLAEVVDLPQTFRQVYGIGKGNHIDSEIQVYMKSQGWPERVQVGLLVGDMMETIQHKYEEEIKARIDQAAAQGNGAGAKKGKKEKKTQADLITDSAKFAGFM